MQNDAQPDLAKSFSDFIAKKDYPCVGAKSALAKGQLQCLVARDIRSNWNDLEIITALDQFAESYAENPTMFQSFVVIFECDPGLSEQEFEAALWARLQSLHEKDHFGGYRYDTSVNADPQHPEFSLSFGGEAFFVVGLHPGASRRARRFSKPTMVFNLHDQFERLRETGRYTKMRKTILERDRRWSGSVNPMLAVHGSVSEARQYSGREVGNDWACPFAPMRDVDQRKPSDPASRSRKEFDLLLDKL